MKKTLLILLSAAICGCGGNGGNSGNNVSNNAENNVSNDIDNQANIDMTVDWKKPLYKLNRETGDTLQKWFYDGNTVTVRLMDEDFGTGSETYEYDNKHRIVKISSVINTGNTHHYDASFNYNEEEKRGFCGYGKQSTEGYSYFTEIEEMLWFLDSDCTLDTLRITFTADREWDDEEERDDKQVESYTVKKYADGKLIEETVYSADITETKDLASVFRSRKLCKYNSAGLLAEVTMVDFNNKPLDTTTYTYSGNTCVSGNKVTYYGKK